MYINLPSSSSSNYQDPVADVGSLPATATEGDIRLVLDTGELYYYDGASWQSVVTGSGGATWGSITGTLSNQTDLQTALNTKADISSLKSYKPQFFTLTALQISSKSVTLAEAPTNATNTRLIPINGIEQDYGVCFTVSGSTLDLAAVNP